MERKYHVLVKDGVVVGKFPRPVEGSIEVGENVYCGMLYDGENFATPLPPAPRELTRKEKASSLLDALNVTRDELLDAILSAMNHAQLTQQINWPQPMDGILSAWAAQGDGKEK